MHVAYTLETKTIYENTTVGRELSEEQKLKESEMRSSRAAAEKKMKKLRNLIFDGAIAISANVK